MSDSKFCLIEFFLLILSGILVCYAYATAWAFYWSSFQWSPLGYETCGLESIAWILFIYPLYVTSLIGKIILWRKFIYPKLCFILFVCITVILCVPVKSLLLGIVSAVAIAVEFCGDIFVACILFKRR